jgi:hypothetical protein
MADLRVKSTGAEFRRIDNGVALLLEEMFPEALERINSAAPAPDTRNVMLPVTETVRFSVGAHHMSGEVVIQATDGRSELIFAGAPERAHNFKLRNQSPPQEIIDEYARLKQIDPEAVAENKRIALDNAQAAQDRQNGVQRWRP